jgi:hypothetical protein
MHIRLKIVCGGLNGAYRVQNGLGAGLFHCLRRTGRDGAKESDESEREKM